MLLLASLVVFLALVLLGTSAARDPRSGVLSQGVVRCCRANCAWDAARVSEEATMPQLCPPHMAGRRLLASSTRHSGGTGTGGPGGMRRLFTSPLQVSQRRPACRAGIVWTHCRFKTSGTADIMEHVYVYIIGAAKKRKVWVSKNHRVYLRAS